MEITYLGHSSFKLHIRGITLVTDPYDPISVGIKYPSVEADIVTVSHSHPDHNYIKGVEVDPVILSGAGEYEVKGVRIFGISSYHDEEKGAKRGKNTIYHINMGGLSIVHMGDIGMILSDDEIDMLDGVDILMLPVGGYWTIDAKSASELITKLEPAIVIPMHYRTDKVKNEYSDKLSPVDVFLKEMGKENIVPQSKLVIAKENLPSETAVVVLSS